MAQPPQNRPAATPDEPLPPLPTRFSTESDLPPADSSPGVSPGSPAGSPPAPPAGPPAGSPAGASRGSSPGPSSGPSAGLEPSPDLAPPPAVPEQPFGVSDETTVRRERIKVPWTRTSAAWLGIWA